MSAFWTLFMAGAAVFVCTIVAMAAGRMKTYQVNGWFAVGNFIFVLAGVVDHRTVGSAINAAAGSVSAYTWWKGGGDDDTKRRLRKLSRTFTGTRRTAPGAAS